MRTFRLAYIAFIVPALTGCGTIHNLKDPPISDYAMMGTGECYPGGGVVRTGLLATMGPWFGLAQTIEGTQKICDGNYESGSKEAGKGMLFALAGVGAWVDLPLSLVGDVVTLPIAYARHKEYPWATRWGEKSNRIVPTPPPIPTVDQAAIDALNKPPE